MPHPPHLEASLQYGIDLIQKKVLSMAEHCERALSDSKKALLEGDGQTAYSVILRDKKIDELEMEIDRLCLEFLVRQQPVAGHLRFAYAAIKINQELERIGDYAESIARQSLVVGSIGPKIDFSKFEKIADASIPMVKNAVKAFIDQDEKLAWKTIKEEELANDLRDQINADLDQLRKNNEIEFEVLTPLMTVARRFERASDQAKNICEEVLYLCTGQYMKHMGNEVFRILFVDEDNSCLSQMAQAIGSSLGQPSFVFSSAGITPASIDPRTVEFMKTKEIDISNNISKSIDQIPNFEHYHVIIGLSKEARKVFPPPPTKTVGIEWSLKNPSSLEGDDLAHHETAYQFLTTHVRDLVQAILGENLNQTKND